MSPFRTSIRLLMILVVLTGIGMAALTHPTALWDSALLSVSALLLLSAGVAAGLLRGPRRAYWAGFTIFGLGYLLLTTSPGIRPRLLTTRGLEYLFPKVVRPPIMTERHLDRDAMERAIKTWMNGYKSPSMSPFSSTMEFSALYRDFMQISHTVIVLLLASLGGFAAHLFALRQHRNPGESTNQAQVPSGHARSPGEPGAP
ncbi:MAG TPA: hypothetical protein VGZ22_11460 [Isosphaeraceae bacterium]|jgi:hypothetical protein|nr:hypothetical protein [Isosphaeraceae bacterium]